MQIIVTICMIIFLLLALIWTIYLKFPQFKVFKKLKKADKTTHQAFLLTLATNLGTGNLVGVTSGIILGGPGVIIWMWIFAFFSSAFAYAENVYATKYKQTIGTEKRGGACFYILYGLNKPRLGIIFAIFLLLTNTIFFPPIQMNTIVEASTQFFNINRYLIGIIVLIIILFITLKGTKSIINFTNKLVPPMAICFMGIIIVLMILNYQSLGWALKEIINKAFSIQSIGYAAFINCMSVGIRRSLFSHEAGLGTTPSLNAISESKTKDEQGYFQMLAVYVDTLIMCTITGIFVVQMKIDYHNLQGGDVITKIFGNALGRIGLLISFVILFLFAFASLIGQYYLGESNAMYLVKATKINYKTIKKLYPIIFTIGLIMGIIFTTHEALSFLDIGMIIIGFINLWVIFKLEKKEKYLHNVVKGVII